MAKKYLLYIHDERFANELEKSKLVNELLDYYYEPQESYEMAYDPTTKLLQGNPIDSVLETNDIEFCKHDAVKGFCKKGCK
jgi:hypothetical protein